MSKRKITKLIAEGLVANCDDPRLFTLTALRRRGFPPQAINSFVKKLGLTGALMLEACVRDELNVTAQRVMAVLEPLKVTVESSEENTPFTVSVQDIPGQEPSHHVTIRNTFYIDRSDFRLGADKDYRRLPRQTKMQTAISLNCMLTKLSDSNKPKAFIQWVSDYAVAEIGDYSRLFTHICPEDAEQVPGGFLYVRAYQFERIGYYAVDQDSSTSKYVFNNTVSLREDTGRS